MPQVSAEQSPSDYTSLKLRIRTLFKHRHCICYQLFMQHIM